MPKLKEHPQIERWDGSHFAKNATNKLDTINMYHTNHSQKYDTILCSWIHKTWMWKVYYHKRVVWTIRETIHVLNLPCGNHYYKQTSTKLTCSNYTMVYKATYLVKAYSILPTLIVNNNQIRVHIVLNGNEKCANVKFGG